METKLYPGIAFSPQAVLTDSIGAADTIIPVSDVSAFPDAPNLATIGVDEEGETVFYTAKTDAVLSGCVRGVEGTAKAWFKGELIARNWTAKDHGDLIAAVGEAVTAAKTAAEAVAAHAGDSAAHEDIRAAARDALEYHQEAGDAHKELFAAKQNLLTGTPGQVVGFGAKGEARAVPGWSNTNLLINSDFRRPVNRNGKPEYTSASHTIDQWRIGNGTVSLVDGRIVVQHSSGTLCVMQQLNQELYKGLSGKIVTISLLLSDGLLSATGIVPDGDDNQEHRVTGATGFGCEICLYKSGPRKDIAWQILLREQNSVSLIAAKLELGPVQTLAYQDTDGNWVLNDPPNYDLQYAHCSLYSPITGAWVGSQHSTPNLLDNWYFADPVNQRGQTEYSVTGAKYTIDRWLLAQETTKILRIVENGISIEPKAVFVQKLEPGCIQDGSQITMSVMINHMVLGASLVWDSAHGYTNLTSQYGFRLACDPLNRYVQIFNESGLGEDVINAVKLELGTQQTLAHQDADGSWVLNDPPPNKALELAKCRSFYRLYGAGLSATIQNGKPLFTFPFDAEMRANPTVDLLVKDLVFRLGMTDYKFTGASISGQYCAKDGAVFILLSGSFDKTPPPDGAILRINLDANIFSVDANL